MRKISLIFLLLLSSAGVCEAGQSDPPSSFKKFDVGFNAAWMEANPGTINEPPYDDWYGTGRYAVTIGHYWTEHLKTEFEYAQAQQGSRFVLQYTRFPGSPYTFPYYLEGFHRLEQGSIRMVWQFGDNSWVHPYVSGGVVGERDRQRVHAEQQYISPTGRIDDRRLFAEFASGPTYENNLGVTVGAGAKFYVSRNAFINAGANWTNSYHSKTLHLFTGIGIDF